MTAVFALGEPIPRARPARFLKRDWDDGMRLFVPSEIIILMVIIISISIIIALTAVIVIIVIIAAYMVPRFFLGCDEGGTVG
jgi:hypothetical protein